jgi:DNA-binding transcriptional MerR regulator
MDARTVGAVADMTGVSVRTLHHYHHIGLVVPSVRTAAGYRGYTDSDVERLHLVLVYRAAGLSLEDIGELLDGNDDDVIARLSRQLELLRERSIQLQNTITAVEELMAAHRRGIQLTAEEQVEIFGTAAFGEEYADEARDRWGETEQWRQSRRRTAALAKDDWLRLKADGDTLLADLADAKRAGVAPGSAPAAELVRRHREGIEQFYDCTDEMHVCLAQMYVADPRFTAYYDAAEPGLAGYVHDLIVGVHH